jgi:hypothetical protein
VSPILFILLNVDCKETARIVSPTLYVNPAQFVIPCIKRSLDNAGLQRYNDCHLLSRFFFPFKFQSLVTVIHYKSARMQNMPKGRRMALEGNWDDNVCELDHKKKASIQKLPQRWHKIPFWTLNTILVKWSVVISLGCLVVWSRVVGRQTPDYSPFPPLLSFAPGSQPCHMMAIT